MLTIFQNVESWYIVLDPPAFDFSPPTPFACVTQRLEHWSSCNFLKKGT